jgi:hypothetical protein
MPPGRSREGVVDDGGADADADDGQEDAADEAIDGEACVLAQELCNGVDDDCDGEIDEDFECVPGTISDCSVCGLSGSQSCSDECMLSACDAACPEETPDCCGDTCVDTLTDPIYCGGCGNPCPEGWECISGVCDDGS